MTIELIAHKPSPMMCTAEDSIALAAAACLRCRGRHPNRTATAVLCCVEGCPDKMRARAHWRPMVVLAWCVLSASPTSMTAVLHLCMGLPMKTTGQPGHTPQRAHAMGVTSDELQCMQKIMCRLAAPARHLLMHSVREGARWSPEASHMRNIRIG